MRLHLRSTKILSLSLILLLGACSGSQEKGGSKDSSKGRQVIPETTIYFLGSGGDTLSVLQAAVADDDMERSQGLMDVTAMPEDTGMIFYFGDEQVRAFWMANTLIPLDIMYVSADSTIVRIYQNTVPFSESTLPSEYPAQYVIETNAGYSVENGITEGLKVAF